MATQLDLQEQEQLDALKAFWKQYGNLITWTITLVLLVFAAWNGWNWYQREQAVKAGVMHEEVEKAVAANDLEKAVRVFGDLRQRFGGTVYATQAALLLARAQADAGKADDARASLGWAAEQGADEAYRSVARLRLAGLDLDAKKYDEALKSLDAAKSPSFVGLVADRRGDVLMAQGKKAEAVAAYQAAWKALDPAVEYRRLVEAKLVALAAPPEPAASGARP